MVANVISKETICPEIRLQIYKNKIYGVKRLKYLFYLPAISITKPIMPWNKEYSHEKVR